MRASQAGGGGGGGGKSGGSDCDWLRQPFAPWDESTAQHALTGLSLNGEQQQQQHPQKSEPKGAVACGVRGCPSAAPSHGDNGDNGGDDDHTAREKDAEFGGARKTYSVTSLDIETLGSPCNVVIRCREGRTPWECVVRAAVGDPVHLDIVLAKEGSAGAKFCFSSYMNQKFEMNMMDSSLVHDPAFTNIGLEVTEEELQRCTRFLTALDGRAAYSYFDAMVLVPLAPKQVVCSFDNPGCASTSKRNRVLASMFDVMAEDLHSTSHPDKIKKVFCSQSVVLMLRHGLDPQGKHSALLESLNRVNSRLVSPRQVMLLLESFGAFPISNDQLSNM